MIYLCQCCGSRINQRTRDGSIWRSADEPLGRTSVEPSQVGKYLLYNHKPFCSDLCIEYAKKHPYIMNVDVIPANILEREPNGWKTLRKINRNRNKQKQK